MIRPVCSGLIVKDFDGFWFPIDKCAKLAIERFLLERAEASLLYDTISLYVSASYNTHTHKQKYINMQVCVYCFIVYCLLFCCL